MEEGGVSKRKEARDDGDGALYGDSPFDSATVEIHQNAVSGLSFLTLIRPLSTDSTYRGGFIDCHASPKEKWNLSPAIHWGQRRGYAQRKGTIG